MNTNNEKTRLFVDMDGTMAEWRHIRLDIQGPEDKDVVISKLNKLLRMDGYFRSLKPHQNVLDAIRRAYLSGEVEVYGCTCYLTDTDAKEQKLSWKNEHAPWLPDENIIFVPDGENKADYVPDGIRSTDVFLDDYTVKLVEVEKKGAKGVKLFNGVNGQTGTWNGPSLTITDTGYEMYMKLMQIIKGKLIQSVPPFRHPEIAKINADTDIEELARKIGVVKMSKERFNEFIQTER